MVLQLKALFGGDAARLPFEAAADAAAVGLADALRDVRATGEVSLHAGMVELHATVRYLYVAPCDRCAAEMVLPQAFEVSHTLVRELAREEDDGGELLLVEGDALDVAEMALADLVLQLPAKHLCRPDCRGLCPQCGQNLNDGLCGCAPTGGDPRWDALKALITDQE